LRLRVPGRPSGGVAAAAVQRGGAHFNARLQGFLAFVLSHYVSEGVQELDQDKLKPLLGLKYRGSIADAVSDLGDPGEIGKAFADFQKYLYEA
jgi:type I restriction enzyme R subunit